MRGARRRLVIAKVGVILDAHVVPTERSFRGAVDDHAKLLFPHVTGAQCLDFNGNWSGWYCRVIKQMRYIRELGQPGILPFGSQPLIIGSAGCDTDHVVRPAVKLADWAVANVVFPDNRGAFTSRVER